jgi:hypothetical protein
MRPIALVPFAVSMLSIAVPLYAAQAAVAPQLFAPGTISGAANEDSAAFAPDGRSVYFDRMDWPRGTIMESHRTATGWSAPKPAPFSGHWLDHDPAMAPDGSFLVFTSNRPDTPDGKPLDAVRADGKVVRGGGGHLWRVDRKGDGWGTPVRLPDTVNASSRTYAPYVVADGSVYFQRPDPRAGGFRLYRSQYRDGHYLPPVAVVLGDPAMHMLDPAVAPDESFIVFDAGPAGSNAPDRLYIAFRQGAGWGQPVDLGDALNRYQPWGGHLGPDHRTLYFTSGMKLAGAGGDWNNGKDNLWSVSLAPWLDAHRG